MGGACLSADAQVCTIRCHSKSREVPFKSAVPDTAFQNFPEFIRKTHKTRTISLIGLLTPVKLY